MTDVIRSDLSPPAHPWPPARRLSSSRPPRPSSARPAHRRPSSAGRRRDLQGFDLPVGGIELLLMVGGEFGDGLLQEIDIALQAAGAPLHGLFDGADLDTGNILRARRGRTSAGTDISTASAATIRPIIEIFMSEALRQFVARQNLSRSQGSDGHDIILKPYSRDEFGMRPDAGIRTPIRRGTRRRRFRMWRNGEVEWQRANDVSPNSTARRTAAGSAGAGAVRGSQRHLSTAVRLPLRRRRMAQPRIRRRARGDRGRLAHAAALIRAATTGRLRRAAVPKCDGTPAAYDPLGFGTRRNEPRPNQPMRAVPICSRLDIDAARIAAHHIQHGDDRPQPAAEHKG